jgi:predicted nuclease of predicted toxin-antitoxin system
LIRLLLDQGLPRSTAQILTERAIEVVHVADIAQSRASEMEIVNLAREQAWVIITLGADFHRILALSGAVSPSVIRIRREGLRGSETAQLLSQVIQQIGSQLDCGVMVTVTARNIRLHRLPIRKVTARRGDSR